MLVNLEFVKDKVCVGKNRVCVVRGETSGILIKVYY